MKVAYLVHLNLSPSSGVAKKIASQVSLWKEMGVEATLYVVTRQSDVADFAFSLGGRAFVYSGGAYSLAKLQAIERAVEDILRWRPRIVYLRRDLTYPGYVRLASTIPVVQEVNSDELAELKLYSKVQYVYHRLTRKLLDSRTKGWVFVTHELQDHPYFHRLPGMKTVIANGIRLDQFPNLPVSPIPEPTAVFMGYPAPWQGIDKIATLASLLPEWRLHLVGVSAKDLPGAPSNLILHGPLPFPEYLSILEKGHIALGTLALHRKSMNEASPLKVREYLALGLPIVIGYRDTDFPGGAPFLLQIPNEERNIQESLGDILDFYEKWKRTRVPRDAITHLDMKYKEKKRILFFSEVVARHED